MFASFSSANEVALAIGGICAAGILCYVIYWIGAKPSHKDSIPGRGWHEGSSDFEDKIHNPLKKAH